MEHMHHAPHTPTTPARRLNDRGADGDALYGLAGLRRRKRAALDGSALSSSAFNQIARRFGFENAVITAERAHPTTAQAVGRVGTKR